MTAEAKSIPTVDARPRTLSSQQGALLSDLSKKNLNWHVNKPSEPNLVYLLQGVGNLSSEKILLCVFFQERIDAKKDKKKPEDLLDIEKTRIDLVEKEEVKKTISLEHVVQVRQCPDNPCRVEMVYMLDTTTRNAKEKKTDTSKAKAYMLNFTFVSRRDAHDTCLLIYQHALKQFPGFSFGQICLHKGYVEKQRKTKVSWVKRYLRLVTNRLLVYRTEEALYPLNIIELSGSGPIPPPEYAPLVLAEKRSLQASKEKGAGGAASAPKKHVGPLPKSDARVDSVRISGSGSNSFVLEPVHDGKLLGKKFIFRTETPKEQLAWMVALQAEQDPKFDQPLKALQAKPLALADAPSKPEKPSKSASSQPPGLPRSPSSPASAAATPTAAGGRVLSEKEMQAELDRLEREESKVDSSTSGSLVKLGKMNFNQRLFFNFVAQFRDAKTVTGTQVWTPDEWTKNTPQTFFSSRGKAIKAVDEALADYAFLNQACSQLLRTCRIVCTEVRSQAAASQIGFAFPGFDSQVFDVGRLAVVAPWQFFTGTGTMAFQESDWKGALQSRCVAKELMQTSPDVSALFESKPEEAKLVMQASQNEVLHNVALASYFRAHGVSDDKRLKLADGDILSWANVLAHFEGEQNKVHLEKWAHLNYVYNPDEATIQSLVDAELKEAKEAAAATPQESPSAAAAPVRSSVASPRAAAAAADSEKKALMKMRALVDPIRYLSFVRSLLETRQMRLEALRGLTNVWMEKHAADGASKKKEKVDRLQSVCMLKTTIDSESRALIDLLGRLPSRDNIKKAAKERYVPPSIGSAASSPRGSAYGGSEDEEEDGVEPSSPMSPTSPAAASSKKSPRLSSPSPLSPGRNSGINVHIGGSRGSSDSPSTPTTRGGSRSSATGALVEESPRSSVFAHAEEEHIEDELPPPPAGDDDDDDDDEPPPEDLSTKSVRPPVPPGKPRPPPPPASVAAPLLGLGAPPIAVPPPVKAPPPVSPPASAPRKHLPPPAKKPKVSSSDS